MGKIWNWITGNISKEIKATLAQDTSPMPGDWITPVSKITSGTYTVVAEVIETRKKKKSEVVKQPEMPVNRQPRKHRSWNWNTCVIGSTVCKGEPSCVDCGKCIHHCSCVTVTQVSEWMCDHCGVPQTLELNQCGNCGAPRPFIK